MSILEVKQTGAPFASSPSSEEDVYDDGYLRIEHQRFYVAFAGRPFYDLARKEFFILSRLARHFGRAVRAEEVWQAAWGEGLTANPHTLRVHVATLRRKLAPYGVDILAVVHVGYRLVHATVIGPADVPADDVKDAASEAITDQH
jgi:two-component system, OmpR family, alkaline phosphatase synthesis response regulator PhoP